MSRLKSLLSKLQPLEIPPHQLTLLTFALFPKLAPELRNMIWSQVACEPRTINIFRLDEDCANYAYPEGFNVGSEIIENIKHIGVEFRGSGSRKSRVTRLVLTRYLLLLHNEARLATIRLTFRDSILWYEADQSPLLLKNLRCLRTNEEYTRDISNGVRKDRDMPALEFFWETKDDEEWGNGSLMG
ncbi:hypothetical protein V8E51_019846 [Hyaloscypha variabilis]